jgi:hypothetical protein
MHRERPFQLFSQLGRRALGSLGQTLLVIFQVRHMLCQRVTAGDGGHDFGLPASELHFMLCKSGPKRPRRFFELVSD